MNRQVTRGIICSSILLLCFLAFLPIPAFAAEDKGRIVGQLVDGGNKNAPLANQEIILQMAQSNSARDLAKTKTDAQGKFVFENLSRDKTITYAAYIKYQGAQYLSELVSFADTAEQKVSITVYPATKETSNIAVQTTLLIRQDPAKRGLLSVSAIYVFQNLNPKTYVGSLDTDNGKTKINALRFSLPLQAKNVALKEGFDGYQVATVSKGFATDAALLPGVNEFSFSFDVPYNSSNYKFFYETYWPTAGLSVYVDSSLDATTDALKSDGIVNKGSSPYKAFSGEGIAADRELQVDINGLILPQDEAARSGLNNNMTWLVIAIIVMIAVLAVTWYLYRAQRSKQQKKTKLASVSATSKKSVSASLEDDEEDIQQSLLAQMLKLDKEYEAGKLKKAVYDERRSKLKARLRTVMREREISKR